MFLDLRQTAIEKLLSFPTTPQTVVLGCTYSSVELFKAGCSGLINRPSIISDDEAMVLGYEMAFRLAILREKKHQFNSIELTPTLEKQITAITKEETQYGMLKPRQPPCNCQKAANKASRYRKN